MIIRARGGDVTVSRSFPDSMSLPPARNHPSAAGVNVTPAGATGVPAFGAAVRIACEAVATLRMRVWRGDGFDRESVTSTWQARLFGRREGPNERQTWLAFWETGQESLEKRGNAYIWKNIDPATRRVTELWALHPDQVMPHVAGSTIRYNVSVYPWFVDPVGRGNGVYRDVDGGTLLHIRGHGGGGTLVAPSPIEVYRDALGVMIQRQRQQASSYAKGTALRLAIELPQEMSIDAARRFRELWRETFGGPGGEDTAVLGGGGTIKPISMTNRDAQFVEAMQMTIGEAARIVGVPASILDAKEQISHEQELARWLRFGLSGKLERLDQAVTADPDLFGAGSATYAAFDASAFVRGDLMTEATIEHQQIQDGSLLIDEARAKRGQDPLPDGRGQIPQIVPVGGSPHGVPETTSAPDDQDQEV